MRVPQLSPILNFHPHNSLNDSEPEVSLRGKLKVLVMLLRGWSTRSTASRSLILTCVAKAEIWRVNHSPSRAFASSSVSASPHIYTPQILRPNPILQSLPHPASNTQTRTMASLHEPTTEEAIALFKNIEANFPHERLGNEKWYLVAISAVVGVEPDHVATLYTYLTSKPEFTTSESRKALIRRLREALVKNVALQGVCKPLEAILAIVKVERPEDQEFSCSREGWQAGPENRARGEAWLSAIYKGNLSASTDNFKTHKDFDFISREITYGFYLSDHSILGPVETELVVLSGIMIQNLPTETAWHLRGIRRVGVSSDDVEKVHQCVEMVAEFGGRRLHKLPRMIDVEHEV